MLLRRLEVDRRYLLSIWRREAGNAAPRSRLESRNVSTVVAGVSSERLVCLVYGVVPSKLGLLPFTRIVALDRSGGNMQLLSNKDAEYSHGVLLYGGSVFWTGSRIRTEPF